MILSSVEDFWHERVSILFQFLQRRPGKVDDLSHAHDLVQLFHL